MAAGQVGQGGGQAGADAVRLEVHRDAIGGTLGALLTGLLADANVNSNIAKSAGNAATSNGLADLVANHSAWIEQLKAIGITLALAVVGTVIIGSIVNFVIGLRPTPEVETQGLDINEHGEEGYIL